MSLEGLDWAVVKNPPANAGEARDIGLIPGSRRSPGEGNGNALHYSCLENFMDRGAWWPPWGCKGSDTNEQLSTRHHNNNIDIVPMLYIRAQNLFIPRVIFFYLNLQL